MLLTHFIWQTDLKPLSGTNAKNGAITLSLTPTMHIIHARCYKASEWVGGSLLCRRGILVILWMSLVDVAVGDLVTCMSFVWWVCLRETWTVVETKCRQGKIVVTIFIEVCRNFLGVVFGDLMDVSCGCRCW